MRSLVQGLTASSGASPLTRALALAGAAALAAGCSGFEASTDFQPEADSFAFANFGGIVAPAMLGSAEVQRLFGPSVCEAGSGDDACVLIPEATQWMLQMNTAMAGGRCEGFAVLSQAFWNGEASAEDFGAASVAELSLEGSDPLAREIAYWFATQGLQSVAERTLHLDARDTGP